MTKHEQEIQLRLKYMAILIRSRAHLKYWQDLAASVVADGSDAGRGPLGSIYSWVIENVTYVGDPDDKDVYYPPERTIERRQGDCDEQSVMVGLLANALGYPVRIRAVSKDGNEYTHVYVLAGRDLVALDTVLKEGVGAQPKFKKGMEITV